MPAFRKTRFIVFIRLIAAAFDCTEWVAVAKGGWALF